MLFRKDFQEFQEVIERMILMLEKDIIPVVPEQGSVGASGDLAPLAHLVLPLLGLGQVWEGNQVSDTIEVLKKHDLEPLALGPKRRIRINQWYAVYPCSCDQRT